MRYRVRRLSAADAERFRVLRLEGLADCPGAFAAAYQEEATLGVGDFAERLASGAVFGGFADGEIAGVAGFAQPQLVKKRHKGILFGVYVRAAARGRGLGRALVERVIEHARSEVLQLHASVVTSNHAARTLYRSLGFRPYGLEPRALKVADGYLNQELLVLPLDDASGRAAHTGTTAAAAWV